MPHSNKKRISLLLAALLQGSLVPAYADDLAVFDLPLASLLQVDVTTVSRQSETIYEAPGIISVVTRDDIDRYGAISLRDVIGRLPGINLLSDGDFQNDNISLRGDSLYLNNHLLILIDGNPYRYIPGASEPFRNLFNSFPLDVVERVELIRGPGSVLYGANAYTGVINIITVQPTETKQSITVGTGSNNAKFASATSHYYDPDSALGVSLNVSSWDDKGWTATFVDINQQDERVTMGEDFRSIYANIRFHETDFTLNNTNRDSDTLGQRSGFMPGQLEDEKFYVSLTQGFEFNRNWRAKTHGSWINSSVNDSQFDDDEYFLEQTFTGQISDEVEVIFGINTMKTKFVSQADILKSTELDATQVFSQLAYQYDTNTKYVVGGQLNQAQGQKSDFVPRLAVTHQFSDTWGAKLLYSEAYRSPSILETSANIPPVVRGNRELESETVETFELEAFYHDESSFLSLSLYQSKQKNLIAPQFVPADTIFEYQNVDQRLFYGSELTFSHAITNALKIDGSAAYQRNKETSNEDIHDITTLPHISAKLGISYSDEHHRIALWDNYVGDYQSNAAFDASKLDYNPRAKAYHYLTAHYSWRAEARANRANIKDFEFSAFVQNVLDKDIRQNSLTTSTPLNTYPSDTSRALYLSFTLGF